MELICHRHEIDASSAPRRFSRTLLRGLCGLLASCLVIFLAASASAQVSATSESVVVNDDGSVTVTVTAESEMWERVSFFVERSPRSGTLSKFENFRWHGASTSTAEITYTPNADFVGEDTFTYLAIDPWGRDVGSVHVTVARSHDTASTPEDEADEEPSDAAQTLEKSSTDAPSRRASAD